MQAGNKHRNGRTISMSLRGEFGAFLLIVAVGVYFSNASPLPTFEIDNNLDVLNEVESRAAKGPDMYEHYGADWPGLCKTGNLQSPIEIDSQIATDIPRALPIVFLNYNLCRFKVEIKTTTIGLNPVIQPNHDLGIASGGLRGLYKFASAHFHWSAEHVVNNKRGALELHLVHYKSIYSSVAEAKNHPNGLAVLGVIYNIGKEDQGIKKLINAVKTKQDSSLTAEELLPVDTHNYFRYSGSLTTPGCDESVVWTVFQTERTISKEQIEWFRNVPLENGKPLKNNYRLIQKTKKRKIYNAMATHV